VIQSSAVQVAPTAEELPKAGNAGTGMGGSVVRFQMFQIVQQDSTGTHVQVFRLIWRVPVAPQGVRAQSA